MNSNNHITVDQIKNDAEVIKKELVECRHYLHAHPELSFKEEILDIQIFKLDLDH